MSNLIETNAIAGFKVYGQQMVEYTVDGVSGRDYAMAIAVAAFAESTAIENEASAYADVLRARQKKLSELGGALATLSKALATMKIKDQTSSDKSDADNNLITAKSILNSYGISLSLVDNNKVTRKEAENARSNTEYAMDLEDNDLQQDMVTLQGLVSKRDSSFSTASKVIRKVDSTSSSIIHTIGG